MQRYGLNQAFVAYAVVLFSLDRPLSDDPRQSRGADYDLIKVALFNQHFGSAHGSIHPVVESFSAGVDGASADPGADGGQG